MQERNEGGQGGTRRWMDMGAPKHCGGRRKIPTMSQMLSSIHRGVFSFSGP